VRTVNSFRHFDLLTMPWRLVFDPCSISLTFEVRFWNYSRWISIAGLSSRSEGKLPSQSPGAARHRHPIVAPLVD
jgi:hypothetical protein